ncbi:MAG: class I SAM-dependent methyltransferase [Actinomycetota bacterium]|nr:class I SAM-dependent methyltransferase [Actinomycetota bacterium]MDQ3574725.1 class I SAM-dependent methyltransferase [Actinomycetota bacterium]
MLTVDYDRLGLSAGDRLLDLGCGGGRHAYEALRRGGRVVAVDADDGEITEVAVMLGAMIAEGQVTSSGGGTVVCGDVLRLPFPDRCFDRVIAAEVLEHVEADEPAMAELARVLRPGGSVAVTVPRWLPEAVNWCLSHDYHSNPGGHVRIYRRSALMDRLRGTGLRYRGRHHAHALHSPYWWLKCAVGVGRDDHRLVRAYHALLVWDLTHSRSPLRLVERLLNPILGKSLVVYLDKPC